MTTKTVLTDDQIIELIEQTYTDSGIDKAIAVSRAIEKAVLASPQIQQALADTKLIDWLADPSNTIGNVQLPTECVTENMHSLRDAIDAAIRL